MLNPSPIPPNAPPISPPPQPSTAEPPSPLLGEIIAAAIAAEGGSTDEVMGPSRKRSPSRSRQAAMWLAFKITPHSLQAIGDAVGRHHSTVMYGIRAYERHLAEDATARARSEHLLNRFMTEDSETEGARS
jgi:hypothetical protein